MLDNKKHILYRNYLLIIGVICLGLSFSWSRLFFQGLDQKREGERIYRIFEGKEKQIRSELDRLSDVLKTAGSEKEIWKKCIGPELDKHGLFFTVSTHDSLAYWSSSLVAFDNEAVPIKPEGVLKRLPTGWFYLFEKRVNDWSITGYMLIKRDFPYQNRYVHSSFQEDFHLSDQCEVTTDQRPGTIQVFCQEGKFHFGIQYKSIQGRSPSEEILTTLLFLLFVILITVQFSRWMVKWKRKPMLRFVWSFLFALFFYLLLNALKLPQEVYAGRLFAPFHFSWGKLISSMGDYLLLSYFLFFVAQSFFVLFRKEGNLKVLSGLNIFFFLFASLFFTASVGLLLLLLNNSDVSLELYSNYSLSLPNILASVCIALLMVGLGAILVRIRCATRDGKRYVAFFVPANVSFGIVALLLLVSGWRIPLETIAVYLLLTFSLDYAGANTLSKYKLTSLMVYGLLLAFGLNLSSQREGREKKAEIQKVMAVSLATERDPAAEIFLADFKSKVVKDTLLPSMMTPPYQKLAPYLQQNYFTGFWNSYELQLTVCSANDSVYLPDERRRFPCLHFFQQLTLSKGVILPGSDFYFMDRLNGRISYLGELHLQDQLTKKSVVAFIELNSKIIPEGKGYPQLLLDQQASRRNRNDGYSYAKYFDNKLVDRGGSYSYDPVIGVEADFPNEFTYFEKNGFSHCVYKRMGANYVIVSYPIATLIDQGRGFPPLFLMFYLLGYCWILMNQRTKLIPKNRMELRGKIQFTLVSTLLVLLFLIGWGLIKYNYLEFQRTLKENLDQKVRAISSELGLRIGHSTRLDTIHVFLGDQLAEISDITWTDINIYELQGRLIASSRNEIFSLGLTSNRMNPLAYQAMRFQGNATFLHNENLGKMEFFSVYAPLYNQVNDLVGYVNLPYYNRQDDFTRQVTGFIVAFINLYILLVLVTMVIALAISTKLTVPLLQIEQKLKGIAFGKQNSRIEYQGEDEIGRLVEAYNKKVGELADSAALLARSERESAWKEMARQIAHEINNPLTPMKLNIQYLQRIKDQGTPLFDEYFDKVTHMLVSQIDALSSIASAFSDFARMPSLRIEPVDMITLIREIVTLFDAPGEYKLVVSYPERSLAYVSGDKDQFRRALVNVIRNASQAIQKLPHAAILVRVEIDKNRLKVFVEDNGVGIAEPDKERLFEPNFTTKSGGMGLGLAISKSILENYNGAISFESEPGKTVFLLDFPLS